MALSLDQHSTFSGRPGPVLVVVADGVGIADNIESNAVAQASTPTLDALLDSAFFYTTRRPRYCRWITH